MLESYTIDVVYQSIRDHDEITCQEGDFETQNLAPCAQMEHVNSIIKNKWIPFQFHLMKKGLVNQFVSTCTSSLTPEDDFYNKNNHQF